MTVLGAASTSTASHARVLFSLKNDTQKALLHDAYPHEATKTKKKTPHRTEATEKKFFASFLLISRLVKSLARNRPCDGQGMYPGLVVL